MRIAVDFNQFDPKNPKHNAERDFLEVLKTSLSNDWVCFVSMRFAKNCRAIAARGECDFVLWHEAGIVILEHKNANKIYFDEENNSWVDWNKPCKLINVQLENQLAALREKFRNYNDSVVPVVGALRFEKIERPENCVDGNVFFLGENDFETRLLDLLQASERELDSTFPRASSLDQVQVLSVWTKRALLLANTAEFEKMKFAEFTREQSEVLDKILRVRGNVRVTGGAGTGKTVLALHVAKDATINNKRRTLVLNWNKLLNSVFTYFLTDKNRRANPRLSAKTFEAFSRELVGDENWSGYDDLWEKTAQAVANAPAGTVKFDTIVIDEAQVLGKVQWAIVGALKKKNPRARFLVFYDEKQVLYGKANLPKWVLDLPAMNLTVNCRNIKTISDFVKINFHDDETTNLPINFAGTPAIGEYVQTLGNYCGHPVIVFDTGENARFLKEIKTELNHVLRELAGKQTFFLTNGKTRGLHPEDFNNVKIFSPEDALIREDGEFFQAFSVHKIVGCEADNVVIWLPFDEDYPKNFGNRENWFYEACTRARSRLFLVLSHKYAARLIGDFRIISFDGKKCKCVENLPNGNA